MSLREDVETICGLLGIDVDAVPVQLPGKCLMQPAQVGVRG